MKSNGSEAVIVAALRTPQAKIGGALSGFTNAALGETLVRGIIREGVDPQGLDEVIAGCVGQYSDAPNVARVIAVRACIPASTPAYTVARNCGSGLQAVACAVQAIRCGDSRAVLAGGVEVMSSAPYVNRDLRFGRKLRDSVMVDSLWESLRDPLSGLMMGQTAEKLAKEFRISRREQDEWAAESHRRAAAAVQQGRFRDEICPVPLPARRGQPAVMERDEGPDGSVTAGALGTLPPVFDPEGTVTAGNACPLSDGAAFLLLTARKNAGSFGRPRARVRAVHFAGVEPDRMGLGPVPAVRGVLEKAGMNLKDIDLMEINEAFAVQYLAVERSLELDPIRVNVNGSGIALGHPVGATGARLIVTLLHEMEKRGVQTGLAALCIGGGQGGAVVIERE